MKKALLIVLLLTAGLSYSQQTSDSLHSQIFSLSPLSRKVDKVNGVAFGLGHFDEGKKLRTINGFNLEVNPLTPLILLFSDPEKTATDSINLKVNGLHIAAGGFNSKVVFNGMGVSVYNYTTAANGLCITGAFAYAKRLNGVHISGILNNADIAKGLFIAGFNNTDDFKGLQIGLANTCKMTHGVQIGLFNQTKKMKGVQIGLWNINEKRSLPFINW